MQDRDLSILRNAAITYARITLHASPFNHLNIRVNWRASRATILIIKRLASPLYQTEHLSLAINPDYFFGLFL